jgi:hypothetical protein
MALNIRPGGKFRLSSADLGSTAHRLIAFGGVVGEPKNPALAKLRDWPMFQAARTGRKGWSARVDGKPLPKISELLVRHFEGTPEEKLTWLKAQAAAGKLDGDDPDELAEAEVLLAMLARLARPKAHKQHLSDLLDEGLDATFPASDPIAIGHFTGAEIWRHG